MEKLSNLGRRSAFVTGIVGTLMVTGLLFAGGANAAGTDPAGDAITGLGTKITTYGGAIVGLVILSMGFWLGIKYLRKATSKA